MQSNNVIDLNKALTMKELEKKGYQNTSEISTEDIKQKLNEKAKEVVQYLYANATFDGTRGYIGNVYGNTGDSLVITINGANKGLWNDFADRKGGDLINLWMEAKNYAFQEAIEDIKGWLNLPRQYFKEQRYNANKKTRSYEFHRIVATYNYKDAQGRIIATKYRKIKPNGKKIFSVSNTITGKNEFPPPPRPLYIRFQESEVRYQYVFDNSKIKLIPDI